jgi:predicted DNA-binding protein
MKARIKSEQIGFRIPPAMKRELERHAELEGCPVSQIVKAAIREHLARLQQKKVA